MSVDVNDVKEFCKEVVENAEKLGIDVEAIVRDVVEKYGKKYSKKTVLTKIRSELKKQIRVKSALKVRGLIAGSRDRWGKNFPIRLAVVRSTGDHIEVSTWSYENVKIGDTVGEIPVPSIAEISVQKDEQYDSYQLLAIEQVKKISDKEAVQKLLQIAVNPSELDESDLYKIVVVKGVINAVAPATKFEDGEPVGTYPVLTKDAREKPYSWPTMQIWFKAEDDTRCRLILERPRYSKPHYAVEDLLLICEDAIELTDHLDQAEYVQDALEGRSVIAVGVMLQYNKTRLSDGTPVNYVDIGVAGLYEYEEPKQAQLTENEEEEQSEPEPEVEEEVIDVNELEKEAEIDEDVEELADDMFDEEEEEEEESIDERSVIAQYVLDNAEWKKVKVDKLDKAVEKYKGDLPATLISTGFDTDDGNARIIAGKFSDETIAALKITTDAVYGYCSKCKKGCKHILTLWQYPGRQRFEKMKEVMTEGGIEKVKKLIRAYCRALNLSFDNIDESVVIEKIGIRDVPVSVIKKAIQELRENDNGE